MVRSSTGRVHGRTRGLSALILAVLVAAAFSVVRMAPVAAANATVTMAGTLFLPPTVDIETGDSVTWENKEATNYPGVIGVHNIVFDEGGLPPSPPINPGESWQQSFRKPGAYAYHCGIHPTQMKGTINVAGEAQPDPTPQTSTTTQPPSGGGGGAEPAATRRVELTVAEKEMPLLGVPETWWTYNGTVPGTTIRANVGDTLEIVLKNTNNVPHAIHTHFREYSMASDGSSMTAPLPVVPHQEDDVVGAAGGIVPGAAQEPGPAVGQNPIGPYDPRGDRDVAGPGQTYTYRFKLDAAGTSWYHCHVFEATDHISKGLYGLIIVYPKGWTWEDLPPDPRNGNTKAWVTTDTGERLFEDLVIIGERNVNVGPAAPTDSTIGLMAQGGVLGGPINVANGRAWNDPYVMGPVRSGQKTLIHVANIGESVHSWHIHGHHFDRMQMFDHPGEHQKGWFTKPIENMHNLSMGPGDIFPTLLTAGQPGFWFEHDHVVPSAYLGMVPWLHVLPSDGTAGGGAASERAEVRMVEPSASDPNSWRFEPAQAVVTTAGTVAWKNDGKQDHDITADEGSPEQFTSGTVAPGGTWEHTFSAPGTYRYHCSLHPWMTGSVTVGESGGGSAAAGPGENAGDGGDGAQAASAPALALFGPAAAGGGQAPASADVDIVEEKKSDAQSWKFTPGEVTVRRGGTVTWNHKGAQPHNVVSTATPPAFESPTLKAGEKFKQRFDVTGTYEYKCTFHPWMTGKVAVVEPDAVVKGASVSADATAPAGDQALAAPPAAEQSRGSVGPSAVIPAGSAGGLGSRGILAGVVLLSVLAMVGVIARRRFARG